ncbi:MAG: hypothetical protein LAT64_12300 [Phycisphaerales bacterium]|nr:hypothetical protein [Planctomycetota bacterium]MCH8509535.1 hypothetical protein [Phycisphaerales bacterium]
MLNRWTMAMAAAAVGGIGLLPATAQASGVRITHTSHSWGGHGSCSSHAGHVAGVIVIDGCRTVIRSGHGVDAQIASAFRRAGYHATCEHGRVVVRFGYRRPSVRWSGEAFGASFSWERDCLIIRTRPNLCGSCSSCRPSRPSGPSIHIDIRPGRDFRHPPRHRWPNRWPGRHPGRC